MDSPPLVAEHLAEGRRLLDRVEQGGGPRVDAAFWYRFPDTGQWRLVLVSPDAAVKGARHVYGLLQPLLLQADVRALTLGDVTVLKPDDPLAGVLRSEITTGIGIHEIWLPAHPVGGVILGDALIYFVRQEIETPTPAPSELAESQAFFAAHDIAEPHWQLTIRPHVPSGSIVKRRSELHQVRERMSVLVRGWDFPHVDRTNDTFFSHGVQSFTHSRYHHEAHRLYRTGMFIWRAQLQEEFESNMENEVMMVGSIYSFTEWFLAASRYVSFIQAPAVTVSVTGVGLLGRRLTNGHLVGGEFVSSENSFEFERTLNEAAESEFLAAARDAVGDLLELFQFEAHDDVITYWQDRLVQGTP